MNLTLLFCYPNRMFNENDGVYYSTIAYLFRDLSKFFEKMYLMAPVADFRTEQLRRFDETPQLEVIKTKSYRNRFLWVAQKYFWSFQGASKFKEYQYKADVVVLNIPSALTCLAYLPLIKKPLVVRVVGDEQEVSRVSTSLRCKIECSSRFLKLRELAEQYLLRKANAIICRNDKFKDKIVKKYGLSKSKISVIVPAINTDIFKPLDLNYRQKIKENLGLKASQLVIGFVSMYISRAKGAVTLLNAFSRLHNESPQVKLLLIGKDKLGLKKNPSIICCGLVNRNKLLHYYNAMDIVVFPSRSEGAAKVVMEAFACGIPVIASNVGATSDWIKDGETGFLVEPGDVNKIVDCCRKLLESEDLRTKIGEAARKYALQNFNHIEITKKNIDVIKGIIPKK